MDKQTALYIEAQLSSVTPLPVIEKNYRNGIRMKIHTQYGETKWITVPLELFVQIDRLIQDHTTA